MRVVTLGSLGAVAPVVPAQPAQLYSLGAASPADVLRDRTFWYGVGVGGLVGVLLSRTLAR